MQSKKEKDGKNRKIKRESKRLMSNNLSLRTNNDQTEAGLRKKDREGDRER